MQTPTLTKQQIAEEIKRRADKNYVSEFDVSAFQLGRLAYRTGVTPNRTANEEIVKGFNLYNSTSGQ